MVNKDYQNVFAALKTHLFDGVHCLQSLVTFLFLGADYK